MKIELESDEQKSADDILKILAGYTVRQAETILKAVASELKDRAVIE